MTDGPAPRRSPSDGSIRDRVVPCRTARRDRRASRGQLSGLPPAGRHMKRLTGPSPLTTRAV